MLKYLITGINPTLCVTIDTKHTQNFSKYFTKVLLEYYCSISICSKILEQVNFMQLVLKCCFYGDVIKDLFYA